MDRSGARIRFAMSGYALIDLAAILPFYLAILFPGFVDLRMLRLFRLLRLLKLIRYSPALSTLSRAVASERRALLACLLIMACLLMMSATAMYHVERTAQPEVFGSIPQAMWWAMAALTTVGFGDVVPITAAGKILGALVMMFGVGIFALPIGVMAHGFANEIHRHDFVVTWGMVAQLPLFRHLDPATIGYFARQFRARTVPAGAYVLREGRFGECMYFIASGEVEVSRENQRVHLDEGDYFGELALLDHHQRTATVKALTHCRLLELEIHDFNDLLQSDTALRDELLKVAEQRRSMIYSTDGTSPLGMGEAER